MTLTNAIATTLNPLVTSDKVKAIYDHASPENLGYPKIEVYPVGVVSERLTNRERLERHSFEVRISQESAKENVGAEEAQEITQKLVNDVIDILDNEINAVSPLQGQCDWVEPIESVENRTTEEVPIISHVITLVAVTTRY